MIAHLPTSALDTDAPRAADIDLEDVATCLSRLYRWRGATPVNVAEHSVAMARQASTANGARCCLAHDMPEAFLGDIASPLRSTDSGAFFEEAESRVMMAVCERFGLPWPFPAEVRRLDLRARRSEVEQFLLPGALSTVRWLRPLSDPLEGWSSARARREFLTACRRYGLR